MSDFLATAIAEQSARVANLAAKRSELERRVEDRRSVPADLASALRRARHRGELAVIAEVKRRSPSAGALADIADAATLASRYAHAGAAAISVLTEERHFGGSIEDLEAVRTRVALPVLRKDFIVDDLQLLESLDAGADAVLLIADALDRARLRDLVARARYLLLTPIVEAHDDDALDRAVASGAEVIGLNQRDLRTLALDPTTVTRLAPRVPDDRVLVAESGLRRSEDVSALPSRVDAVLVGEAFVRAADPEGLLRAFRGARAASPAR